MDDLMICGPENVTAFNARLREHAPEAFDLAKALHAAGLIPGLAGARIGPVGSLEPGVQPTLSDGAEKRLADAAWARKQGRAGR
jgi:hypothetical protein